MKKEFNKTLIVIGFIVAALGTVLSPMMALSLEAISSTAILVPIFVVCFVFAKNNTVKNFGYALTVVCGANALSAIFYGYSMDQLLIGIGLLIMFFAGVLYFLVICLKFFGFVKNGKGNCPSGDPIQVLSQYKDLVNEKIVTEEEFDELKRNLLANGDSKVNSIEDLKKWKKALDQKIITEDEYASVKASVFSK